MTGYIYKYENILNNKVYIGQTINLHSRIYSHQCKSKTVKTKFYNAVRKYGWNNFNFCVLEEIEDTDLNSLTITLDLLEIEYIRKYNSYNIGYNSTLGGHSKRGYTLGEEFANKCRNRKFSLEVRLKMSNSAKKKIVSELTKNKLRIIAFLNNIYSRMENYKLQRIIALQKAKFKPIIQLDSNNKIINKFESFKSATLYIQTNLAKHLTYKGILRSLYRHCNNLTKCKEYYGFIWKYESYV